MKFTLFPKNDRFFDLFTASARTVREGAEFLLAMTSDFTAIPEKAAELKRIETRGDRVTHEIVEHLNASFITPMDREDIYALARALDEVLDEIEGVGSRMEMFNVEEPTAECVELVNLIVQGTRKIEQVVTDLRAFGDQKKELAEVRFIEHQADLITRRMTAHLFHDPSANILNLIKWKEIYSRLEHTADRLEDVANTLDDIIVKHN